MELGRYAFQDKLYNAVREKIQDADSLVVSIPQPSNADATSGRAIYVLSFPRGLLFINKTFIAILVDFYLQRDSMFRKQIYLCALIKK